MKIILTVSRILLGALFIVSGLVKVNDPLGFSYKLEEYFSPDVLGMEWMLPYALACSVVFSVLEVVLGIAVLFGFLIRWLSWVLLGMMVFFTFLTFYSAFFDKVTECGCFGDALKIKPWHSFWKDVVLLILTLILFFKRKAIRLNTRGEDLLILLISLLLITAFSLLVIDWAFPAVFFLFVSILIINTKRFFPVGISMEWTTGLLTAICTAAVCWYCMAHLPLKDYRPYAIGKNIRKQMEIPEGKAPPKYAVNYTLTNRTTHETRKMNSEEYVNSGIWKDDEWEITHTSDPILIEEGYEPPIQDFGILSQEGDDLTDAVLDEPAVLLFIFKDIATANISKLKEINILSEQAEKNGYKCLAVTASLYDETETFRHQHQTAIEFALADETILKTMIRSNPGLILLKKGTIAGKWHYNDFPTFEALNEISKPE